VEDMPMKKEYHKGQELTMSELRLSLEELAGQPLELFARERARLLLSMAMEEELTDVLRSQPYERSQGKIRDYHNGHRERQVSCGAGIIQIPKKPFVPSYSKPGSAVASSCKRHSLFYVEGLSTRDLKRALKPLWEKSGLSRSSVSRANKTLKEAFNNWRRRDLSLEEIIYLFLDVVYVGVRGSSLN